ncbi:hypothetical protein EVAR_103449_1 [Eumeta japonica]|uniref:Uncharacterized protein n=1 Tax=Eumeta variegata TaxID=151549 RepID=A0A4C1Z104_EUMVA|nr:hypothetical protein EVAR_103449_1 [Eumeta japonica]
MYSHGGGAEVNVTRANVVPPADNAPLHLLGDNRAAFEDGVLLQSCSNKCAGQTDQFLGYGRRCTDLSVFDLWTYDYYTKEHCSSNTFDAPSYWTAGTVVSGGAGPPPRPPPRPAPRPRLYLFIAPLEPSIAQRRLMKTLNTFYFASPKVNFRRRSDGQQSFIRSTGRSTPDGGLPAASFLSDALAQGQPAKRLISIDQ